MMEQRIWKRLGISQSFSIEERLFLSTTILSASFIAMLSLPVFLMNSGMSAFYILLLGISLIICYLLVRVWRLFLLARILLLLVSTVFPILIFPLTGFFKGPVVYGLVLYFNLTIVAASGQNERRLSLFHILALTAYLVFGLSPMPGLQTAAIHYLTICSFAIIFYLGTGYLKMIYDRSSQKAEKLNKELLSLKSSMEKQILETKELNAQKDRLFSIIGHDLRSPLSGIEGFLNVLDHGGVPDNERKIMQNELLRLTRGSRQLLDNLLQWAKRGTKAYEVSKVDYPKLIQQVGVQLRPLAEAKGIKLQVLIDEGEGSVMGDADMLEMIIRNLIANAIKFTPVGGWIKVRAYELASELRLEVEDNGIGMTEQQREKLFSPHREVGLGTNREKGVGLGLMLCTEFLTYMNGKIEVRSVKDKGSCFTVHLPRPSRNRYPL